MPFAVSVIVLAGVAFCAVPDDHEVDYGVFVAADKRVVESLLRIPVKLWRAKFADSRENVRVLGVENAAAWIDRQTVIIVDLVNTPRPRHQALLAEALSVSRACTPVDLTFMVIGDSPELITQFPISSSLSVGVHHTQRISATNRAGCATIMRGRREWHWARIPEDPFYSLPRWFAKAEGPIRVLWLAGSFEWFGDGLACDPITGNCRHQNPAVGSLRELVRKSMSIFPVLSEQSSLSERIRHRRRACAQYFAEYLGGQVLGTGQDLGDGRVLVAALDATAGGFFVKLRSRFSYTPFDLVLRIRSQPNVLLRRWLAVPHPGDSGGRQSRYPVDLIVDLLASQPLEHLVLLAGAGGGNERIQVDLPVPASPESVVHVVLASSGGVDEKPLISRYTLRGEELIRLGEALRVSVPIPAAHPLVRRVSVLEEKTKWAGYYVAWP